MIGDNDDESVIQDAKLFQVIDEHFEAAVVVKDLAVVAVLSLSDEAIGIYASLLNHVTVDDCAPAVLMVSAEGGVLVFEGGRL